jgi:inosine-uridine nucleoside N-ribohydrolase
MKTKNVLLLILCISLSHPFFAQKIILNADTGNEMDDLYAIAYMLGKADETLIALSAAHFNNVDLLTEEMWNSYPTEGIETMKISCELNKELLQYTGRLEIPCLKGSEKIIGRAWGGNDPRPSETSKLIIDEATKLPEGQKLVVFTIGPVTDVASAIIENPSIESKIVHYMMGASYVENIKAWNKSDFNVRNDINNAFDYLLNSNVEMHIMTSTTSRQFKFDKTKTKNLLNTGSKLDELLSNRWEDIHAGEKWTMWDLALIIAYFHPEMATEKLVNTPPINKQRKVFVYTDIDTEKMENEFWKVYKKKFQ